MNIRSMFRKRDIDMVNGPLLPNIIRFTLPIIATSVLQLLFNAADLVVVGQFRGDGAVAAVGAVSAFTSLLINLFTGLSLGVSVTVAHAIGAGRPEEVRKTVHTAVPTALVGGGILLVVGLVFARPLLELQNTPPEIIDQSVLYMKIYFCGMVSSLLYNYGSAILRAAGDSKSPLVFLALSGVVNVGLNILFVAAFGMDVEGVALATALSQTLAAVLVLWALWRRKDGCHLDLKKMRFDWTALRRILRIGLPAGAQGCMFDIGNVLVQTAVNGFGQEAVSGGAAAASISSFVYVAMYAYSQTAVNFVGQNVGAHKPERVRSIYRLCMLCVAVTGVTLGALSVIFARPLLGIYLRNSEKAIAYGITKLWWVSLPYFLCGTQDVTGGSLRGMGCSLSQTICAVVGILGTRVLWILALFPPVFATRAAEWSYGFLFASYPVSWGIVNVLLFVLYLYIFRKMLHRTQNTEPRLD